MSGLTVPTELGDLRIEIEDGEIVIEVSDQQMVEEIVVVDLAGNEYRLPTRKSRRTD